MKQIFSLLLLMALAVNVNAYDFSVKNDEGLTIYYNYVNNGTEVEVTYEGYYKSWNSNKLKYDYFYGGYRTGYYGKKIAIPEIVTYNERSFPVTRIGTHAFQDSYLKSAILPNSIKEIGSSSFQSSDVEEIIIPNSVIVINSSAFKDCTKLKKVSFSEGLKEIRTSAFSGCNSLTQITIPESVTVLNGFNNCLGLKEITIPKNVTDVYFSGCDNLTKVYSYINNPSSISTYAFSENTRYAGTLYVPKGTIEKYKSTSGWSSFTYIEEMPSTSDVFKLTYLVDGKEYKTYEIEYGSPITPEAPPTKEGYTFSGWSKIPGTMPDEDVVVSGTFVANKYNLVYQVDGKEYKSYKVEYGSSISPIDEPTKEGYTFSGWSEIPKTMPANDITVTGTFTINKYKLTYWVEGIEYKSYEIEFGSTITPETAPEKEGYTFSGWSEIPETMPAHDVTVVGTYSAILHTLSVAIVAGKGTITYNEKNVKAGDTEFEVTEGTTALLKIIPASNYILSVLTVNGEDAINDVTNGALILAKIKTDMTVNVSFERTSDKYNVTMTSAMSTLCVDEDLDFTNVSGLEAYIGSGFDMETGTLLMTRVYDVPSGTGLLLKGEPGTYDVPYSTSHSIYVNLLKGLTEGTILEQTLEGCTNYLLSDGAQGLGFYAVNVATVLEAGKAYLPIPTVSAGSRQCIRITYGETTTTGISDMESTEFTTDTYYDMQGRKHIGKPVMRGVYMTNGRKVLVK